MGRSSRRAKLYFFQMVRDGKAPIVGSGNNKRSMAYVDNICDAMWRAAAVPTAGAGQEPDRILLNDRRLQVSILLWLVLYIAVMYIPLHLFR